jgi:hypothetical protein
MPSASVSSESTVSPISGTVVSWSIQGAAAGPGYNVVVPRRNPIGTYPGDADPGVRNRTGSLVVKRKE